MASKRISYKYLILAGLSLLLATCSVEKNTDTSRFYHSLTARFNIYFNGYESFKSGVSKIINGHRDDYAEILNVFEYSDPSTAGMGSGDMEKAIQKASKVISLKSITARPEIKNKRDISEKEKKLLDQKEFNGWIDDSYLLIGKSRFYKHEFTAAEDIFIYCIAEANDPLIRTEASIWLARTNNENKNYSESSRLLNEIKVTGEMKKYLQSMYYSTLADLYIKQKRYAEALDPLNKAVLLASGKRAKYRLTYLLAQLYEQAHDGVHATALYRKVVGMNPPYEVEFNARINIAGVFDVNSGNPSEINNELGKMLRDAKNRDFHDQIYYALGNLSARQGNDAEAIGYYKKSAHASTQNQNQKGRSYLSLADYFYNKADYMNAGLYYDSAVLFIDQKYPGFTDLRSRSRSLKELVSQLVVIEREDSLQRVAMMTEPERIQLISSIIAKVTKNESEGKTSDYNDRYNIGQYYENERRFQGNIEQEGKWYFYNQAALTFGRTEFRRRWSDRKLEDNWRRMNKTRTNSPQASQNGNEPQAVTGDTAKAVMDNKKPEFYLKNLPLNDSLIRISNERLANAFLNAGKAYSDMICDTVKSADSYETLVSRFPASPVVPEALYNLYSITRKKNTPKSETYRQRLIEKYPESEFARILSDPMYFQNKTSELRLTEKLYEEAYAAYGNEKYAETVTLVDTALKQFPDNPAASRFMLLRSYAVARISDERGFKEDLEKLIKAYPATTEGKRAAELIAYLNQKVPELKIEEDKEIASEIYKADTLSSRTFALVIPDPKFNMNQANFDVISYNIDYYTNRNFKTEGALIDNKFIMITVSGFSNYTEALNYYYSFNQAKPVRSQDAVRMMTFVISGENLKTLYTDKNPDRYNIFFKENLLKSLNTASTNQSDTP